MYEKELNVAITAGLTAKGEIMDVYGNPRMEVEYKDDKSPVTEADKKADEIIREVIHSAFPNHNFLTEESPDDLSRLRKKYVWIVDPVDGTKDFIKRDGEFTTNIALCIKHEIVVAVVVCPAIDTYYYASKGNGAFKVGPGGVREQIHVSDKTEDLTCLISVFHTNDEERDTIKKHSDKIKHVMVAGSALKACRIAEGKAELSYRLSDGTKEWDTAAFQLIVEEAGGKVLKLDKTPIKYNREDVYNRGGYIILNREENFLL